MGVVQLRVRPSRKDAGIDAQWLEELVGAFPTAYAANLSNFSFTLTHQSSSEAPPCRLPPQGLS